MLGQWHAEGSFGKGEEGVLGPDGVDDAADDYGLVNLTTGVGATGEFEAVIELDTAIDTDKLLLTIFTSATDLVGNNLDGQWTEDTSIYPFGNGSDGGDFGFGFNVLLGDITQNGIVDSGDLSKLIGSWLQDLPDIHPLVDINGNTQAGSGDLSSLIGHWLSVLPVGDPSNVAGGNTVVFRAHAGLGHFGFDTVQSLSTERGKWDGLVRDDEGAGNLLATARCGSWWWKRNKARPSETRWVWWGVGSIPGPWGRDHETKAAGLMISFGNDLGTATGSSLKIRHSSPGTRVIPWVRKYLILG